MTSGPINAEPKRSVEPHRGHGLLLTAAAWAGICATQLADRFPDVQAAFWVGLLAIVLLLANVARRL